jgi:hypothetical protein
MTQQPYYQPQYPAYPPQAPAQQPMQAPPVQYAPQQPAGYPAPAYGGYPAPVQQQAPLAQGTLDDFYNQPSSGGGPSLKFEQIGTRYIGIVTRPLGPGDVQQQTDTQGRPLTFRDGSPKWVMKVPLQMQPSAQYPDGLAQWYVKGGARDELTRAMAAANAPAGPPEQGAIIDITFVSTRNSGAGMNPAKVFQVVYTRPQDAGASSPAPAPSQPVQQAAPVQAPVQQQQQFQAPPQQFQGVNFSQLQAPQAPPAPQAAAPAPAPAAPQGQLPPNFTPEQAELFARLAGQQQGQQGV